MLISAWRRWPTKSCPELSCTRDRSLPWELRTAFSFREAKPRINWAWRLYEAITITVPTFTGLQDLGVVAERPEDNGNQRRHNAFPAAAPIDQPRFIRLVCAWRSDQATRGRLELCTTLAIAILGRAQC